MKVEGRTVSAECAGGFAPHTTAIPLVGDAADLVSMTMVARFSHGRKSVGGLRAYNVAKVTVTLQDR